MSDATREEEVAEILRTGPRGILTSPYNKLEDGVLRMDLLNTIIPELRKIGRADNDLELKSFPNLKHVIQNSHASISGTIKFKHFTVYAQPSMNTNSLPSINASDKCSEFVSNSGKTLSYSNEEVLKAAEKFNGLKFGKYGFYLFSVPFSSPLALTLSISFTNGVVVEAVNNKKYVTFPQTYNLKNIVYLLNTQKTEVLFTEPEMLQAPVPNVNLYLISRKKKLK